jgi:uncharacterized membrane protein
MTLRIAMFSASLVAFGTLAIQTPYAGSISVSQDTRALEPALRSAKAGGQGGKPASGFATLTALPSLGAGSEALAVNAAGTVVVGTAWDRSDLLHAVRWTLQNGKWTISSMPWPAGATSAAARGVNNAGDAAGSNFPGTNSRALLWPVAGGLTVLDCSTDVAPVTVYAISGDAQVVAGSTGGGAAVWQPGSCRTILPMLFAGGFTGAFAVNGDGTIVGGRASDSADNGVPVRWRSNAGQWQVEALDSRPGAAMGSNGAGDLTGSVSVPAGDASSTVPCNVAGGCQRAVIWSADGSVRTLGTLGGADSWARDINTSGDVVGGSTSSQGTNTGYIWFGASQRMVQLPVKGQWAAANAVSDVRVVDGTRLVVGMASTGGAVVWVVRNQ